MQAPCPRIELAVGVVAAPAASSEVQAHETPVGGRLVRLERAIGVVADDERDAVLAQQRVHVGCEPARVTELEGVTSGWQRGERSRQPRVVTVKRLGQLPQHGPQPAGLDERLDPLEEALRALGDGGEALDVRQVAARLHREQEAIGRLAHPLLDGLALDQPVEGRVDLDGVEQLAVALEPAPLRQSAWIDRPAPVGVVPARAADVRWRKSRAGGCACVH